LIKYFKSICTTFPYIVSATKFILHLLKAMQSSAHIIV